MPYEFELCCDRAADRIERGVSFHRAIRRSITGAGWKITDDLFHRIAEEMRRRSAAKRRILKGRYFPTRQEQLDDIREQEIFEDMRRVARQRRDDLLEDF